MSTSEALKQFHISAFGYNATDFATDVVDVAKDVVCIHGRTCNRSKRWFFATLKRTHLTSIIQKPEYREQHLQNCQAAANHRRQDQLSPKLLAPNV